MDAKTAHTLAALDRRFYERNAESFSATRRSAWPGWRCIAGQMEGRWGSGDPRLTGAAPLRVLDVACGNLRFERFLREAFSQADIRAVGIDACASLVPNDGDAAFIEADIISSLLAGESVVDDARLAFAAAPAGCAQAAPSEARAAFDMVACFGFFHHVPTGGLRGRLLAWLLSHTAPDGLCAVSLWRFMDDPSLAEKARASHRRAFVELALQGIGVDPSQFGEGDSLLGWQGRPGAYRYAHSFSDAEVASLAEQVEGAGRSAARFRTDGRSGTLNEYLIAIPF